MQNTSKRFPMLTVLGTHYEVGLAIGRQFKQKIRSAVTLCHTHIPNYDRFISRNAPYYRATQATFPHLIKELEGISSGSGVNPSDYFFLTNPVVQKSSSGFLKRLHLDGDHCSTIVSFNSDGAIIGHNEDFDPQAQDDLYLLKATIGDTTFFGLQYVTEIPGASASINNFGLVQCINELHTEYRVGIPKHFISRAVLECHSINQAKELITTTKNASGYNHVLVQGSHVTNIEISGNNFSVTYRERQPYFHTNHYLSETLLPLERYRTASTRARYRRLKDLVRADMSLPDIQSVLRDHHHPKNPICRHNQTLASVVFEPSKNLAHICHGRPCEGEYITYNL